MAKNLQVNLAFTADTSAAMQNLQTLRNSLNEISALPFSVGKNISSDLQVAANSASSLQKHLGAAMDVKTGNLNLNKLQSSLQQSNQSLSQLTSGLLRAGTTGEKAFIATYSAIAQSNLQLKKSNTLLSQFALTMKNTAKWQLSSSLLHGLISGFNQAIDYAKDLNTSLNNIQIVTGQSSAQMAEFAKQANKAAKELRSTTVAYTDAALIYYQQGLDGKAVTDRANTTVKLANVTGESAETVSQWMTAVWNNFDDGSKSLEYYADVMTALGAATASSSDEIATGLEKFAAVADTVGLSYESATAALATITATTRQSADVVGTALKTLFARVQDLDLGKTLEDGTTLGSYSEALNKVGINIKDQSGQLKEMDDIIDEMGTKWKTLDKDQQVALAKNVAGIRQYTQLIALMDNYDFYKQNQDIASGAEGTLEEQAKIYEESWAAASKNVKASLESMYNVLIPTDFIVDFTNGLADVVSGFTDILDAAGGLKTILLLISSIVLSKFQVQIANAMDTGIQKTQALIQSTRELAKQQDNSFGKTILSKIKDNLTSSVQSETQQRSFMMNKQSTGIQAQTQEGLANALNQTDASGNKIPLSEGFIAQIKSLQQIEQYNTRILNLKDKMTQTEFEELQLKQQQLKALGEESATNVQKISDLKLQLDLLKDQQSMSFNKNNFVDEHGYTQVKNTSVQLNEDEQTGFELATQAAAKSAGYQKDVYAFAEAGEATIEFENLEAAKVTQTEILDIVSKTKQAELEIQDIIKNKSSNQDEFKQSIENTVTKLVESGKLTKEQGAYLTKNVGSYKNMTNLSNTLMKRIKSISTGAQTAAKTLKISETAIKNSAENGARLYTTMAKNNGIMGQTKQITQDIENKISNIVKKGASIGTTFVKGLQGLSQTAMGLNMISSAIQSIKEMSEEGEASFSGVLGVITSLGMGLPMVISGLTAFASAMGIATVASRMSMATTYAKIIADQTQRAELGRLVAAENAEAIATMLGIDADKAAILIKKLKSGLTLKETLEEMGLVGAKGAGTVVTGLLTAATWLQTFAMNALNISMSPVLAITLILVAAMASLVAVFLLVSNAIKLVTDWYNKDAIAAEKATKRAKELGEQYNKTKQAYDELKNSLENYQTAYNAIAKLKEGTVEWRQAVIELNQQVLDLISKYPELAEYVTNKNGILTISKEGQEEILKAQQNKVNNTYNAKIDAELEKSKTANQAKKTDLIRGELDTINDWAVGIGATLSAITGTLISVGAMGMDAGAGAMVGATGAAALIDMNEQAANESEQALDLIVNKVEEMGNAFFNDTDYEQNLRDLGITNEELIERLIENKQSIIDLTAATIAATEQEKMINSQKATQLLASQGLNMEHYGKNVQDLATNQYQKEVEKKQNEADIDWTYGKWYSLGIAKGGTTGGKEKANEYGQAMGYQDFEVTDFRGKEIEFQYKDGDETKTTTVTYEEMEKRLAENAVSAETALLDYTSRLTNTITDLANSDNSGANALASFLEDGDLSLVPPEAFQKIRDGNLAALMPEGADIEQVAKDFGYKSVEELEKAIKEAPYDPKEAINNINRKTAQEIEQIFADGAEALDTTEEALESYTDSLIKDNKALQENKKLAAQIAVQNMKVARGLNEVQKVLEDNADILKEADENSIDYHEAIGQLSEALTETFGMKVDAKFIKNNLEDIKAMANNDVEALQRVRNELNKDFIMNLNVADDEAKTALLNSITELGDMALNADIGTQLTLDNEQAMAAINEALYTGEATIEDIEAMFANANLAMPEYKTMTVPGEATTTHTETDHEGPLGIKFHSSSTSTTTTDRVIPYFGDAPKINKKTGKVSSYGGGGSVKVTTTGNKETNKQQLQYQGSDSSSSKSGDSSSKTATKEKKNLSDEIDFYHDINREIERLAETTDKLADAKDRAFGDDKIKNLNAEIRAIQAEIKAQEKLIERAKQKIELDKQALKTYGATYDKNGEITNYDQMLQNEINKYNSAVDTYNQKAAQKDAGKLSDEQWEAAEKTFEAAEERYNKFEEAISTYEADLDIKDDAVEEAAEKAREILDKQLEGIQYIVDVQIEVNDRDLKVLERLLDRLEDDLYDGTERIANMTKQIDEQFDNIEIYKAGIRQTLVSAGAGQSAVDAYMAGDSTAVQGLNLTEEQMQMLQDYTDGIMESEDAIIELREEIENQTMITFDAWHEKIEKNGQAFEHATTMAESYKNIIDLVGKTRLKLDNSILKDLEETQMNAMTESMSNAKAQMDTTQNALNKAKEELEKARQRGSQEDIEKWEKDIETLNETLMEDQENFVSSWEAALQQAADIFTDQINRAFEELEDNLAGTFKSFDELSAAMDKQQQVVDRFMDAGKKQYELSKLNRKLQQNLDKTDSIKAQKELLKLQKEIEEYQASGVEMSERDLTALQKKYELKLAEIALEEAQNTKSQVRLTRDSQGNFGYVYTADENKIADAQQNYEDKLEENRQLAIEQSKSLSEAIVANRKAMVEALRGIRQEDYEDTEAYMQALQETTQFYKDQEAYLISEAQKVIERSQDIYANDYLAYDGWNLQKLDSANNYNTILSDTQLQAYEQMGINTDGWVAQETETMQQLGINILDRIMNGDGASGINGIMEALGSAEDGSGFFGASRIAAEAWASSYAEIMGQAGITIGNYGNEVATVLGPDGTSKSFADFSSAVQYALYGEGTKTKPADGSVNGAVEAAKAKTVEYATTAQEKFGAIANSVTIWQSTYSGKIKSATQDTNNLNTAIKNLLGEKIELITNIKEVQSDINKLKATIEGLGDKTFTINHNTNNTITTEYKTIGDAPNSGTQGDGIPQVGDTVTFESGVYTADSYGGGSSGSWGRGGAMKISLITDTNRARPYHLTTTSGGARGWVSLSQISGYDTGGYTGEWGPDGKLAFLHQKEIVLNASDTENLLTAVQMIREISGQLEANAMAMKYIKTLENYGAKVNIDGQTLQQDVTIHAEFPNATNHNEIEEAFKNLTTLASQYANRKN